MGNRRLANSLLVDKRCEGTRDWGAGVVRKGDRGGMARAALFSLRLREPLTFVTLPDHSYK